MKSNIATKFNKYLESLRNSDEQIDNYDYQIYVDLYKIRESLWKHKVLFKREKDHTISEVFQDLIAKYIKIKLGKDYTIILKRYHNKCQPDILIEKNGVFISAIEVKTTIGYNRELIINENYIKRIKDISTHFKIPRNKIIYVFESCSNVTSEFKNIYLSNDSNKIKKYIYPLYKNVAHPYTVKVKIKQKERKTTYELSSNEEIDYSYRKVTLDNFDKIIERIK